MTTGHGYVMITLDACTRFRDAGKEGSRMDWLDGSAGRFN
jgi:hypothetical protein